MKRDESINDSAEPSDIVAGIVHVSPEDRKGATAR
jgi:hypothetical protein